MRLESSQDGDRYKVLIIAEQEDGLEFLCFDPPSMFGQGTTVTETIYEALQIQRDVQIRVTNWGLMGKLIPSRTSRLKETDRGAVWIELELMEKEN